MPRPTTEYDIKGVTSHNNMFSLDGSKKLFCPGCGGPRDVVYAATVPCSCCGALGTQKVQPLFDEHGEPLSADEVAALRATQAVERAKKAPVEQAAPAPKPAPKAVKPAKEASRTSARQPNAQVLPKPATKAARTQQAAGKLAALFG